MSTVLTILPVSVNAVTTLNRTGIAGAADSREDSSRGQATTVSAGGPGAGSPPFGSGSWAGERPARCAHCWCATRYIDRGGQYLSLSYTERLTKAGNAPSVGRRGDSYDNELVELVIGLFKTDVIRRRRPWRHLADVESVTLASVTCFNTHRLLEPLGYVPRPSTSGLLPSSVRPTRTGNAHVRSSPERPRRVSFRIELSSNLAYRRFDRRCVLSGPGSRIPPRVRGPTGSPGDMWQCQSGRSGYTYRETADPH